MDLKADKAAILMADVVIWGTKDFQVPENFNFADVIDEWAEKEKVKHLLLREAASVLNS